MTRLVLQQFMPFRLNRLAAEFSEALTKDYARFGIDIAEWRVLATLGACEIPRSANYVVRSTRTHKSRVSRAVAHLVELGLVSRTGNGESRREVMLSLTPQGGAVYNELVPLLLRREEQLLASLDADERRRLDEILGKIESALGLS